MYMNSSRMVWEQEYIKLLRIRSESLKFDDSVCMGTLIGCEPSIDQQVNL